MKSKKKSKKIAGDVEYLEEDQRVKLTLRRPVYFNVPTSYQEEYNPKRKIKAPESTLELEWVYGYRGRDSRNNIAILPSNEIVYFVAAVGVVYNFKEHSQRHYIGHTDDIKCLALHPDGVTIATGQTCGRDKETDAAHVRIWSSETLETLLVIGVGEFERCVNGLAFSVEDNGETLAAVDDAPEPKLSLWNWAEGEKLTDSKVSADPILGVSYSNESPSRVVINGKHGVSFWLRDPDNGRPARKTGIFGSREKPKYITAVAFSPDYQEPVTGDSLGNLHIWKSGGNTITSSVEGAHEGSVFCIYLSSQKTFITSGKDFKIKEFTQTLEPTGKEATVPEDFGAPRQVIESDGDIIVGTTKNCILLGSFEEEFKVVSQGHPEELWALASHPTEKKFVTCGRDGIVHVRDIEARQLEWSKRLGDEVSIQSCAYSPNGEVIVLGAVDGKWFVVKVEDQEIIFEGQDGDEAHQMIKFSPDGSKLALGSRDNFIYIYEVQEDFSSYTKFGTCEGHSSFITHIDWTKDSQFLRSNSGDYEILFWDINSDCARIENDDATDFEWHTYSCLLSFYTLGVWPEGVDGTDVNTVNKGNYGDLLATGDDFGKVKLFKYPASYQHMKYHEYGGHSSHVTCVVFSHDDSHVLSAGGRDTSAIQWKVSGQEEVIEDDEE